MRVRRVATGVYYTVLCINKVHKAVARVRPVWPGGVAVQIQVHTAVQYHGKLVLLLVY